MADSVKILLIEDDADLLDLTAYTLRREQWSVIEASDAVHALHRWRTARPDVVLIDLCLPRGDGFEILKKIREVDSTPAIVVTASTKEQDLLRAFEAGADDFITKPFSARELVVRIRAIVRRSGTHLGEMGQPTLEVGDFRLDPELHEIRLGERVVRLTPIEFRIFHLLAINAGRVVTNSRLLSYVWGPDGGDPNALRAHVCHIRAKLNLTVTGAGTINGVPLVGYSFRLANVPARPEPPTSLVAGIMRATPVRP
jgi:DNA-binding response OmpR family regulator